MEVNTMNILEMFSLIFCVLCLIVFVIARKMGRKEELLLEKLSDEEIESINMKNTRSRIFLVINLGTTIVCCIYLVISIVNKRLLIDFFGETLNGVINSIIIFIILLPHLLEHIRVIRRYNKLKQILESK